MAELLIKNLDEELCGQLEALAREHGTSVGEEARQILAKAVTQQDNRPNLGSRIAACFEGQRLEQELPELKGYLIEPLSFEE